MNRQEAERLGRLVLEETGIDEVALVAQTWPGAGEEWHLQVTVYGRDVALRSESAVLLFIQDEKARRIADYNLQRNREWNNRMHRYLYCRECGSHYSADPDYYTGRMGYLACCGRAVQLYQMNPMDHSEYLLAEMVDVTYLQKPHMDLYAPCNPLPLTKSPLSRTWAELANQAALDRPPAIPAALRQPVDKPDYGLVGLMLYHAGYKRNSEGVWIKTRGKHAYAPFQDGDRIIYETTDTFPFDLVKTHAIPDFYGIRFKKESEAA
jgi:hypothetical protein